MAFTKAPQREGDTESINHSVRQAVNHASGPASKQLDGQAETHSLAFFQSRTTSTNSGEPQLNWSN